MIWFLRFLCVGILLAMLAVTLSASADTPIWQLPPSLTGDKWFWATLCDAYFGFLFFFIWVAYKEAHWGRAALWFVLIMVLGNFAMASYALIQLVKAPANASLREVLT